PGGMGVGGQIGFSLIFVAGGQMYRIADAHIQTGLVRSQGGKAALGAGFAGHGRNAHALGKRPGRQQYNGKQEQKAGQARHGCLLMKADMPSWRLAAAIAWSSVWVCLPRKIHMLIVFHSKVASDVLMLAEHALPVLEAAGKDVSNGVPERGV